MSTAQFVGLVLAGGQSSRMGTDKSELIFQKKTFLERACSCLREAGIAPVIVSGAYTGYECIQDEWPLAGPAAAILAAMLHSNFMRFNYVMVLPVDMPLLLSSFLTMLIQVMEHECIEAAFIRNHPFPCCIKVSALKKIAGDYLRQPNISMKKLLTEKLNYKELDFTETMLKNLININTPEALSQLRMEHEA